MKQNKIIKKQLEFVAWLIDMGIYNNFDSAETMVSKQQIWELAKKHYGSEKKNK